MLEWNSIKRHPFRFFARVVMWRAICGMVGGGGRRRMITSGHCYLNVLNDGNGEKDPTGVDLQTQASLLNKSRNVVEGACNIEAKV